MFKHIDNLPLKNGVHVKLPEGIYIITGAYLFEKR
jgi:hypothetical protein